MHVWFLTTVTKSPRFASAGGPGYLGTWARICQRTANSFDMLLATLTSLRQVRATSQTGNTSNHGCLGRNWLSINSFLNVCLFSSSTYLFFTSLLYTFPLICHVFMILILSAYANIYVFRLPSADSATLCGNLEEILTFQQDLCSALDDCTK